MIILKNLKAVLKTNYTYYFIESFGIGYYEILFKCWEIRT